MPIAIDNDEDFAPSLYTVLLRTKDTPIVRSDGALLKHGVATTPSGDHSATADS